MRKIIFTVFAISVMSFLYSCGEDDSNEVSPDTSPAVKPPPAESSVFITTALYTGFSNSLAWSTDLVNWTTWHNGIEIYKGIFSKNESWFYGYSQIQGTGLYKSVDGLNTLQRSESANFEYPISMVKNNETLAVLTSNAVHITNDDGVSWSSQPLIEYPDNDIFSINGQFVFFAQSNDNIYISDDGLSWNINNHGYKIVNYLKTNSGIIAITNNNRIFKIAGSFDEVTDTLFAFRNINGNVEELNEARYILNDENNFEVFGYFYDSLPRPVKGISIDGGQSWTYEPFNLPKSDRNNMNTVIFPYERNGFKKYDDFYIANLWSNLRNDQVPHFSTDGGINWQVINDENLYLYSSSPIIFLE